MSEASSDTAWQKIALAEARKLVLREGETYSSGFTTRWQLSKSTTGRLTKIEIQSGDMVVKHIGCNSLRKVFREKMKEMEKELKQKMKQNEAEKGQKGKETVLSYPGIAV